MLVAQCIVIATLAVDGIVDGVDGTLLGGGANGAIRRAGRRGLRARCRTLGRCATESHRRNP